MRLLSRHSKRLSLLLEALFRGELAIDRDSLWFSETSMKRMYGFIIDDLGAEDCGSRREWTKIQERH